MAAAATEITMPQMGAEMEEGTLLRWIKHPGDHVARGEVIAEIETDKANIEIESFEEGVLQGTLAEEGQVVPVGQVIATIATGSDGAAPAAAPPAEATSTRAPESSAAAAPATPSSQAPPPAAPQEPKSRLETPAQEAAAMAVPAAAPSPEQAPSQPQPDAQPAAVVGSAATTQTADTAPDRGRRLRVSPVARGIADELGLDLQTIHGSGPDGRIMRRDVERAAAQRNAAPPAPDGVEALPRPPSGVAAAQSPPQRVAETERHAAAPPQPAAVSESLSPSAVMQQAAPAAQSPAGVPPEQPAAPLAAGPAAPPATPPAAPAPARVATTAEGVVPFTRMRQAIARNMATSKREAPHYYVTAEVDMTEAMQFRSTLNDEAGDSAHVSVNDLIVKACADVLRRYPRFNASYTDSGLRMHEQINVCIAVALPDGLIAPALLDTGGKSLGAIARASKDLAGRARNGGLRGQELADGTFTISNLGMYGIETLIPIIQPPQSAILGVGAVQEKPAVVEGQIVIRKLMMVALAADHRVTDGAEGGEFLRELKHLLEHPIGLAL